MRAYVMTTGAVFGLVAVAHIWRVLEEGTYLLRDPFWVILTLATAAMSVWAWRVFRGLARS